MVTVYLALGSNIGDSVLHISNAIDLLREALQDIKQAPLYVSKAVGYTSQPDFINTAISGQTELSPQKLLTFIHEVEQQIGRVKRFRWGPREIDIDIVFYGEQVLKTTSLVIPHPRFSERDFVLQPIVDLDSQLIDPLSHQTVSHLLNQLDSSSLSILRKL